MTDAKLMVLAERASNELKWDKAKKRGYFRGDPVNAAELVYFAAIRNDEMSPAASPEEARVLILTIARQMERQVAAP